MSALLLHMGPGADWRPLQVVMSLLSPALREHLEEVELERTLQGMIDVVLCPRCETPCVEDRDHMGVCPGCHFAFCSM